MTTEHRRAVRALISQAVADGDQVAASHRGLPVYADLGGQLLLREDLSVLVVPDDGASEEAAVHDTVLALVLASERFPTLAAIRPVVDDSDPVCDLCGGRGHVGPVRCGRCCGLGRIHGDLRKT